MTPALHPALLLMIAVAPLVGALAAGLFGKTIGRTGAHSVTIAGVALSFLLSVWTLWQVIQGAGYDGTVYEWMRVATPFGALKFEVGFLIDALTALMMYLYTIGYMRDDSGYTRFFAYLSLFTFAMLMLVMSNNFLQLFFGWEAV